jgi:outer membrane murein-binding lipoprotein Lpp
MRTLLLTALAVGNFLLAGPSLAAPTDQQTTELKAQADTLSKQLDQLPSASSTQAEQLATQHWLQMQNYMRSFPAMGCPGCGRMMSMKGGGMTHGSGMHGGMMGGRGMNGDMMGGAMMDCPMMGGQGSSWSLPQGMTPNAYHSQMHTQMQGMREQLAKAQATHDPAERERLLQEAWGSMYRNMQTMRGMGWMWTPPLQAQQALPESSSESAQLVGKYCSQCHAAPSPSLHTAQQWSDVATRMRGHMQDASGAGQGIMIPSQREFDAIVAYLGKHGS